MSYDAWKTRVPESEDRSGASQLADDETYAADFNALVEDDLVPNVDRLWAVVRQVRLFYVNWGLPATLRAVARAIEVVEQGRRI